MDRLDWILLSTCVLVFAFFTIYFVSKSSESIVPGLRTIGEKVDIKQVTINSINPTILLIDVEWRDNNLADGTIVFNEAIVKNGEGKIVDIVQLSEVELPSHTEKTLSVNFNDRLPSGEHTVTLATPKGSIFVSPKFALP